MASLAEQGQAPLEGPVGIGDQMGGVMMCCGALVGLVVRERTGMGQRIDVSGLSSLIWLQQLTIGISLLSGIPYSKRGRNDYGNPLWNYYRCRDGKWIMLSMLQSDRYWPSFCRLVDRPDLIDDPGFRGAKERTENHQALIAILDDVFACKDREEWVRLFEGSGEFIYSIVNNFDDLKEDVQVLANKYVTDFDHPTRGKIKVLGTPLNLSKTPGTIRMPAPELGQHTEQVLVDLLGLSWEEIADLQKNNVI